MIDATKTAVDLAAEYGINLEEVTGTGADGRILKSDVEAHIAATTVPDVVEEAAPEAVEETASDTGSVEETVVEEAAPETAVPPTPRKKRQPEIPRDALVWVRLVYGPQAMLGHRSVLFGEAHQVPYGVLENAHANTPGVWEFKTTDGEPYRRFTG